MDQSTLLLAIVLVLGAVTRNAVVALSAGTLIIMEVAGLGPALGVVDQYSVKAGILLLTMGVLIAFPLHNITLSTLREDLLSKEGLIAVSVGIAASYLSARGVALMESQPTVIIGLIVGSIIGIIFARGIPAGPVTASGIAAILLQLLGH